MPRHTQDPLRRECEAATKSKELEEVRKMFRLKSALGTLVLGTALVAPLLTSGCAARVRYYDDYYSDYHPWNDGEARAYRVWLGERHYEYREFNHLSREQQRDYWHWRHDHSGRY
jgi:hypothetical protein